MADVKQFPLRRIKRVPCSMPFGKLPPESGGVSSDDPTHPSNLKAEPSKKK